MNKLIKTVLLFFIVFSSKAQIVNIPDANFKSYLVGNTLINTNNNSEIEITEANSFAGALYCSNYSISDLTGIEYFTSLVELQCQHNQIDSLDLTNNIFLEKLSCGSNQMDFLNISNCDSLFFLDCGVNNLVTLDLTNNINLRDLVCYNNDINSLDLSNCSELLDIYCSGNNLQTLDVSNCDSLGFLSCNQNQITTLEVGNKPNLEYLYCRVNNIAKLDVSGVENLKRLWCHYNNIDSLSLENNDKLESLICESNNLTYLNTGASIYMTHLNCEDNNLQFLDISNNNMLEEVYIGYNKLTSIDISNNSAIIDFACYNNHLYSLDFSSSLALEFLECQNNYLSNLFLKNDSNINIVSLNAIGNPDLECIEVDDSLYSATNWSNIDAQSYFNENCTPIIVAAVYIPDSLLKNNLLNDALLNTNNNLEIEVSEALSFNGNIDCSNLGIEDMTGLEAFNNIVALNCSKNLISTINLSQNTVLNSLNLGKNQFENIDISSNTLLEILVIDSNKLSSINLDNNLLISKLDCKNNSVTNLDLVDLTNLIELDCSNNSLSTLNLKNGNNSNMIVFDARNNVVLDCIEVDDESYSASNWLKIDSEASFKVDCSSIINPNKINELSNEIIIYPNPTSGFIRLNTTSIPVKIEIIDLLGKTVLKNYKTKQIDISDLKNGVYYIKISFSSKRIINKIIKS